MERTLYDDLVSWKTSFRRKPLLLRGARQTGKTFLLRELGAREYDRLIYCNFEEDPGLESFFRRDLDPHRIVAELSIYKGLEIRPEHDLIVFDEIQSSNLALSSLKYFQENANTYHVAAAGSLLGVRLSRPGTFPVGKVSFLELHPMSFLEFLDAMGKPQYRTLLCQTQAQPLPAAIHTDLVDLLRKYYFVGGMPEAVGHFSETGDVRTTREIHQEILSSYVLDFAKHAPSAEIPKLGLVWDSITYQLAKENKKFTFSAVKKGARAREYENALRWLHDAGLIHLCHAVSTSRLPLKHYADRSCFKVFALDVGLLGAMAGAPPALMVQSDRLFTEYRGALAESYVAQQLTAAGHSDLYYWRSPGKKAELDFLCEVGEAIIPIEVKAGLNLASKSLKSYYQQLAPAMMVRTSLLNLKRDGKIYNIPLYAISQLSRLANA
jgi:predicted AAA+ superfamily ATPase